MNKPVEIPYEDEEDNYTAEKLVGTARYYMPNYTKNITNSEDLDDFFSDKSLPFKMIYFSEKEDLSHDIKGLSSEFRNRAHVII